MDNSIKSYLKSNFDIFVVISVIFGIILAIAFYPDNLSEIKIDDAIFTICFIFLSLAIPIGMAYRYKKILNNYNEETLINNYKFLTNSYILVILYILPIMFLIFPIIVIVNHGIIINKIGAIKKNNS